MINTTSYDDNIKNTLAVRIIWWGEDGVGSIFRPKIIINNTPSTRVLNTVKSNENLTRVIQTNAKYSVKSGPKQLTAYLTGKNK